MKTINEDCVTSSSRATVCNLVTAVMNFLLSALHHDTSKGGVRIWAGNLRGKNVEKMGIQIIARPGEKRPLWVWKGKK